MVPTRAEFWIELVEDAEGVASVPDLGELGALRANMVTPVSSTRWPVGGNPMKTPCDVPCAVQRAAAMSPWATVK